MAVIAFSLFKRHVRADDFADDDSYLYRILETAEDYVIRSTNRSMDELVQMGGGTFPKELAHAIMMLAGHWYNQRESVAGVQMHEIPYTISALVKPFRRLSR